MDYLAELLQYVISGITSGSIYAIVGVCFTIVFIVTKILNFATGEYVMLGGMLTWVFYSAGLGLAPSALLAIVCTIIVSYLIEKITLRPVRYPSDETYMVITIAVASVIKGIVLVTFGYKTHTIQSFVPGGPLFLFGAFITRQSIFVLSILLILSAGLTFLLNRTIFGKALRAAAINSVGAQYVGIKINSLKVFCFCLAGGLGAIAGIVIAPITFVSYSGGAMVGLKGLVAAIAGGWSIPGTVVAGLLLGLVEALFAGFVSPGWKDAFALMIMIVVLVSRTINVSSIMRKIKL